MLDRHTTGFVGKLLSRKCREGTLRRPWVRVVPALVARRPPTAPSLWGREGHHHDDQGAVR
jgi:hypothetical protein